MANLREQISGFLIHEETPVDAIIDGHSMEEVFATIQAVVAEADPESVMHALTFVRDAALYPHPHHDAFRAYLRHAPIWDHLKELLYAPNFHLRGSAIYTIGKLTHRDRAHLLIEAFPFYLEKDPINLPSVLLELVWLTNQWDWNFLQQTATARHYIARWSLCAVLDDRDSTPEIARHFLEILASLKRDPHPLVAAEASFRFERIQVKLGPKLPKPEWRTEVKRIAELKPRYTFESAAMQFMQGRNDYTLEEFDRFLDNLAGGSAGAVPSE